MKTDVIIIGSGQAGVPLAVRFAKEHREVVLIERAELGGTCINDGCTPTKTMIASARSKPKAGELIHVFVGLMQSGAGARAIVDAEFVHPTFAEGLQSLVMRLPRFALS